MQPTLVFDIETVPDAQGLRAAWGIDAGAQRAMDEAAALAGVEPLLDRRTDELSGGEWQRLRLARAIAQACDTIVLDEPTTFLDIAHEMAAFELLAGLARRGRAILAVSHQLNLVSRFASHVVLLHRGAVAAARHGCGQTQSSRAELAERELGLDQRSACRHAVCAIPRRERSVGAVLVGYRGRLAEFGNWEIG